MVVPYKKSAESEQPPDTRPISLLPVERSTHAQLTEYLNSKKIISPYQSGNRKIHCTETALLCFTDQILKNMDMKQVSIVVLLDMS